MCVYWLIAFETFCVANRKRISTKRIEKVHHIPKFVFVSVRVLKSLTHLLSLCVCVCALAFECDVMPRRVDVVKI